MWEGECRMFFLGHNFVPHLLSTFKPQNPQNLKNLDFFKKIEFFPALSWRWVFSGNHLHWYINSLQSRENTEKAHKHSTIRQTNWPQIRKMTHIHMHAGVSDWLLLELGISCVNSGGLSSAISWLPAISHIPRVLLPQRPLDGLFPCWSRVYNCRNMMLRVCDSSA